VAGHQNVHISRRIDISHGDRIVWTLPMFHELSGRIKECGTDLGAIR
jgi:hypothetical protein